MIVLENTFLRIAVRSQGAELTSLFHKSTGIEHLWQADPAVWGWHAPTLFPIVGGLLNDQLLIDGKTYPMKRHGFARQSTFDVIEATDTQAVFSLRSSAETKAVYPYDFEFQVRYQLTDNNLHVTYAVINEGSEPLFFSVGAHPAFNVPFRADSSERYADYYLEFDQPETLQTHRLSDSGLFTGEMKRVPTDGHRLHLTGQLFDQDALVFKSLNSRQVTLRCTNNEQAVSLRFNDFPYLGIWAKPGASFVCIEPWLGYADAADHPTPIDRKPAIQSVEAGQTFDATFTIGIQ